MHCLRKRTEDYAMLFQGGLVSRGHRHAVKHRIDGDSRHSFLLFQRDPQLLVSLQQTRVDFIKAVELDLLLRRRIIDGILIVDWRILDVVPCGFLQGQPVPVSFQPPFQKPAGLVLL